MDKDTALAYGIVDEADADRMVDVIRWKIPKSTIFKADLMILDMVAHFDWKRPIYFASSADKATYMGLDKYFFAEGLVYKLVPIEVENSRNPNSLGEVNKTRLYTNLMETFEWGNMSEEGVLIDYYTRRITNNYRVQFSVLADAYGDSYERNQQKIDMMNQIISQGLGTESNEPIKTPVGDIIPSQIPSEIKKSEEAMADAQSKISEILDKSLAEMPHVNVPFGKVLPSYISAYYIAGNEEKAQLYSNQMFDLFEEEMDYYLDVDPQFSAGMIEDMYSVYRSIYSLYQGSTFFGTDKEHQDKISQDFFY